MVEAEAVDALDVPEVDLLDVLDVLAIAQSTPRLHSECK
jgi:hypothetical protein